MLIKGTGNRSNPNDMSSMNALTLLEDDDDEDDDEEDDEEEEDEEDDVVVVVISLMAFSFDLASSDHSKTS